MLFKPIQALEEPIFDGRQVQVNFCLSTRLLNWEILRLFEQMDYLGFFEVGRGLDLDEDEYGKFCLFVKGGVNPLSALRRASDENRAESLAPSRLRGGKVDAEV